MRYDTKRTNKGKAGEVLGLGDCEEYGIDPEEVLTWATIWEDKQWFFTYSGAKKHLELNGHNIRGAKDYVNCLAWRNPEMVKLFEWLRSLRDELKAE